MKPRITEAMWLKAKGMLDLDLYRSAHGRHRKWRLFAAACCRRAMVFLPDPRLAAVADAAERFADDLVTWDEMKVVRRALPAVRKELGEAFGPDEAKHDALNALDLATVRKPVDVLGADSKARFAFAAVTRPDWDAGHDAEEKEQLRLVYDIFGNPFRPVNFDPSWRTSTAVGLARTMYESRDFATMPVLADALEEADCDSPDVLAHCRDPNGVHVRGCWVVDLVLGRA
jgi:hypothetical protein